MTIRVVSYNVLVPIFTSIPYYYHTSERRFLKADYRWNLIRSQLEQEIVNHENTVVCLQELSRSLLPKFEEFFRQFNYTLHYDLYGKIYNDYMGVGIAVPSLMHISTVSMIKVGDRIRSMTKLRETNQSLFSWAWAMCESVVSQVTYYWSDRWNTAMARNNTLIYLEVTINDKTLCLGVYHMPCLYKLPHVMIIHASIVKDLMFELAAGRDFILAGDFNIEPRSVCYAALTRKDCDSYRFPESSSYEISYRPNRSQVMKSAYREMNGDEPAYTNCSNIFQSSRYCGTLDYIFFSGHLTVESVLKLPSHSTSDSYPDETHPSDHLLIAATFRMK